MTIPTRFLAVSCVLVLSACAKKGASPEPRTPTANVASQPPEAVAAVPYRGMPLPAPPPDAPLVGDDPVVPAATDELANAKSEASPPLSDAQILAITEQVNAGEIAQAELARTRAQSSSVKQFAEHALSEHSKAQRDTATLAKQVKLAPEQSRSAVAVNAHGEAVLATLREVDVMRFDRAYIGTQIEQEQRVLSLLDGQLIPGATDPLLRAQLERARAMGASQIAEAQKVQRTLLTASGDAPSEPLR